MKLKLIETDILKAQVKMKTEPVTASSPPMPHLENENETKGYLLL